MNIKVAVNRGVTFVSVSPHEMTFAWPDGETFTVPPSGVIINATPVEEPAGKHPSGADLVRVKFSASEAEQAKLDEIEAAYPGCVILGSVIAAQAFPGRVLALIPVPGFERVPQKKMRADKFTVY
jgi:hypothetical protein